MKHADVSFTSCTTSRCIQGTRTIASNIRKYIIKQQMVALNCRDANSMCTCQGPNFCNVFMLLFKTPSFLYCILSTSGCDCYKHTFWRQQNIYINVGKSWVALCSYTKVGPMQGFKLAIVITRQCSNSSFSLYSYHMNNSIELNSYFGRGPFL